MLAMLHTSYTSMWNNQEHCSKQEFPYVNNLVSEHTWAKTTEMYLSALTVSAYLMLKSYLWHSFL